MKLTLIPWELIWLACLFFLLIGTLIIIGRSAAKKEFLPPKTAPFYVVLLGAILIPVGSLLLNYHFDTGARVSVLTIHEHPVLDLQTRTYDGFSVDELHQASIRAVQGLRPYSQQWMITNIQTDANLAARLEIRAPWLLWTNRMAVGIVPTTSLTKEGFDIIVLNTSAVGAWDFGGAERQVKRFYQALDAEVQAISP
jgi:hypothetical protein